ncbi:hypothetical protein EMPS_06699 [Entomortierella parvispora]|uniref:Ricin B lectin domain-containing protein n=1 Tax=Entomortierella parvispora TaxID=205924 RepID=A0A9P3HCZ9_9FUNG|nr:hypothetical protein EMPS_06699 [Entomortierella parvispora]
MQILRTRLASLLLVACASSIAILQTASGLTEVSETNAHAEAQSLDHRDHGAGHLKHHQHLGHLGHPNRPHHFHDKEGKGKQDGPRHRSKDKHHHLHHNSRHKKPNVSTYKISLVCSDFVIDTIQCPVRPTDPGSPPSCHAMNNNVDIVYIFMQEPCSKDLPTVCPKPIAMAVNDESEIADLPDNTVLSAKTEGNHALYKRNRGGHPLKHRDHHGKNQHHHHGRGKHGHKNHRHKHCHDKDKNKHPYKDLCVAVGDFCGNALYGCDFVATTLYRCDAIGQRPKPIVEDSASCGGTKACLCPASPTGIICGQDLPKECKVSKNSVYDCSGGAGTIPKLVGDCESGKVCRKDDPSKDATCVPIGCECSGDKVVCSDSFPDACGYSKNTIYRCTNGGKPEKVIECQDPEVCTSLSDGAICKPEEHDKCVCPTGGSNKICGSQLPEDCKAQLNGIYDCSAGGGTKPSEIGLCPPGIECVDGAGSNDAICGSYNCDCTGDLVVCSNAFPEKCKLQPNTIYKCTASGRPAKVTSCKDGETCITVADGSICRPDDCKCTDDGVVCGDAFPAKCNLKTSSLYDCKKGGDPVFKTECSNPGRCTSTQASMSAEAVFKANANDRCIDGCTCGDRGKACASTFPPECNYPLDSIVDCSGSGATPTNFQKCVTGACIVSNGDDRCSNNKCTCPGDTPICGFDLPKECNAKPHIIYYCPDGKGTEPVELTECKPGTICNKKDAPIGAACGGENCDCPGDKEVCSNAFPDFCGYEKNAIYECTTSGKPMKRKNCEDNQACVTLSDGAVCTQTDCKCPTDGDICGIFFPQACRIPTDDIYSCVKGEDPVLTRVCGVGGCIATVGSSMATATAVFQGASASDKCVEDPCKCQEKGDVCGSTFPSVCNFFSMDTLYGCTGNGATPTEKVKCAKDKCIVTAGDDVCDRNPCACEDDSAICGSAFSPKCDLDPKTLYKCDGAGSIPTMEEVCDIQCIVKEGPDECSPNPCICKEVKKAICGNTFNKVCGLDEDTLYECSSVGAEPKPIRKCDAGCEEGAENSDDFCRDLCVCPESKKDKICGSELPDFCKGYKNAIYHCPNGEGSKPLLIGHCEPGLECVRKEELDDATCGSRNCECNGNMEVCSDSFPKKCGLDSNTIYKCTASGRPAKVASCNEGEICIALADGSICRPDDCKCTSDGVVCGDAFPAKCNLRMDALFDCKRGEDPVFKSECDKPGRCFASKASISAASVFKATSDDKCVDGCTCGDKGIACTSTFPPECGLQQNSIVECSGTGAKPTNPQVCKDGHCVVSNGNDRCSNDKCTCPGDNPVCGSDLPKECNAKVNIIYHCPDGKGTEPQELFECMPGTICHKKGDPAKAICGPENCECFGDHEVCSSVFPDSCGLDENSIYKCTLSGKPEKKADCLDTESCVTLSGGVACAKDDCKCHTDGDVCGAVFPYHCRIPSGDIYSCVKGETPDLKEDCGASECIATKGSLMAITAAVFLEAAAKDRCAEDPCQCQEKNLACGLTFPEECKLSKDTLYECTAAGETPREIEKCDVDKCIISGGDNRCDGGICACKDEDLTCGSAFPPECKLDPRTLYNCAIAGSKPTPNKTCKTKCVEKDGPDECDPEDDPSILECRCKDDYDICGVVFPEYCRRDPNTLYKCSGNGTRPSDPTPCTGGQCLVLEGNDKCSGLCLCREAKEAVCGNKFDITCGLDDGTLYECPSIGATPKPIEKCKAGCEGAGIDKPDVCKDPCACPTGRMRICGYELPAECMADKNAIYLCPGGDRSKPSLIGHCMPGVECVRERSSDNANCGTHNCDCVGSNEVCSDFFPGTCGLEPNTVYRCTANGKPEKVAPCGAGEVCITVSDGSICRINNCKCLGDGPTCGEAFPPDCNIPTDALYDCKKGEDPVLKSTCPQPGRCSASKSSVSAAAIFKATADDKCVDGCKCEAKETVCAWTFPSQCNLPANSLVECSGPGAKPTNPQICENNACLVNIGHDRCSDDKCTCVRAGLVCGSELPSECHANDNTVYNCAGQGSRPEELSECPPGTECIPRDGTPGAVCGSKKCDCFGHATVCSDSFPESCGLDKNSVYQCTSSGRAEKVQDCEKGQCVQLADGAICTIDKCKCPHDGDVCGAIFPMDCKIPAGNIYTCVKGEDPILKEECPVGCISTMKSARSLISAKSVFEATEGAADKCTQDPCKCPSKGVFCGSNFPESCGYDKDTLYDCKGLGETPIEKETCAKDKCINLVGENRCDKCLCPTGSTGSVCGSKLPNECNADKNTIYDCSDGPNTTPLPLGPCKPGVECVEHAGSKDADCGSRTCDCSGDMEVCSNSFPDHCGMDPNTIYKCTPSGRPIKVASCKGGETCITVADGSLCRPDNCKCTSDGVVCGDAFPDKCHLKTNSLYDCKKGEDPVFKSECDKPGRCFASKASISAASVFKATFNDKCVDGCSCGDKGTACTSTFPPECNLPANSIVECFGPGVLPKNPKKCEYDTCIVNNGNDKCSNIKCTCSDNTPVCGFNLPEECNAKKNTIYHCPGGIGTEPEELTECKPGTICNQKAPPIGAACGGVDCECIGDHAVCSEVFPDYCKYDKNTIYRCTRTGQPQKIETCADDEACVTLSDGPVCTQTDCKCPTDGDVCGSVFPQDCRIPTGDIYSCVKGEKPVLKEDCGVGGCISSKGSSLAAAAAVFQGTAATDKCVDDPCKCQERKLICGVTFPEQCQFPADTLYECTGNGATPTIKETCEEGSTCVVTAGDNKCKNDKCFCPTGGTNNICGSQLPVECKAHLNGIYDCSAGGGTRPSEIGLCPPGVECVDGAGSNDAICGSHNCDCTGDLVVCSNAFPDKCKLQPNTIYKCTASGRPAKVTSCKDGETCITVADGSICRPDDCKCTDDGVVCGDAFPARCDLKTSSLYDCKKGENPIFKTECSDPGRCTSAQAFISAQAVFKANANDRCIDGCTCGDRGKECTSTFPPECSYPVDSIVDCSGSGATPTNFQKCVTGACIVSNGEDRCSNNKCTCPGDTPICGFDLPEECNAKPHIIYYCPDGKGTEPVELTECKPGTICNKKDAPIGAACGGENCDCPGDREVCSNAFPDFCGYEKNAIYECTTTGKPLKRKNCEDNQACVTLSDGAVCTQTDCKCPTDGDVCGLVFPQACRIPTSEIYSCVKGEDPVLTEDCGVGGCIATVGSSMATATAVFQGVTASDKCVEDPCKCQEKGDVCGSTFPGVCNFSRDTLYECIGYGATPTEKVKCAKDKCIVTAGDDKCDNCICPTGGTSKICGSQLHVECKAHLNGLYDCSAGAGTTPSQIGLCPPGIECVDGAGSNDAICGSYNCDCFGDLVVCSNAFPDKCGLQPNTIYKCTASGRPAKVTSCKDGETCITVADGSICRPDDCKCTDDGVVCGDAFPAKCNLKTSALYDCKKGEDPVFKTECSDPGRCTSTEASISAEAVFKATANDRCIDGCTCGDRGKACTSTFPPECNYPLNSIVDCSASGATPTNFQKCVTGACIVSNGEDRCSNNKCTCPGDIPICGYDLPEECNANRHSVYYCPDGKGTEPKELTECKPGTICNRKEPPVGAECGGLTCECPGDMEVCSNSFPDTCGYDKNAIYKCTTSGRPTKTKDCENNQACVTLSDGAVCTQTDCKCPTDGNVCGLVFPQACRIPTGDIYSCVKGEDPVLTEDCGIGGCIATVGPSMEAAAAAFQGEAASDKCVEDPCKCQEKGDACGFTFPEECHLPRDTLYRCSGKDATPEKKMECDPGGCIPTAGDDLCRYCICPDDTPTCGSVFGPECNLDSSTLYSCSHAGALPLTPTECAWGCDVRDGPDRCNADCLCKNGNDVCGSTFPSKCGYKPDTLYKCSGALADPSAPVDCAWGCDAKSGPDSCNVDCLCVDKDDVCGSDFPPRCGYKKDTLYKCTDALADPSSPTVCKWGCDIKPGPDKCNADCQCKDGDDVCGSVFPPKCGLEKNALYKCAGPLADPTSPVVCRKGCDVRPGPDKCNTDCLCKSDEDVCGSEFPDKCGFDKNSLYKCSGAFADPTSPIVCRKGCDVKPGPDKCNIDCLCKNGEDVCGSEFPEKCGFDKNALYKCAGPLADPTSPVVCRKGCDVKPGPDKCNIDCLCKNGDDVCGSEFPDKCGFDKNALYKCAGPLADPTSPVVCRKGCDVKPGPDKCNTDCLCKNDEDVCGSEFPDKCGFDKNYLYKCSGPLADPTSPVVCRKGCDVRPGPDKCNTDCLCKNGEDVCGSEFPDKCGFDKNSLYKCSGALADPTSPVVCRKGCDVKPGPDQCNTDCLCKNGEDVCGSEFPPKCGLQKDSLYKCSGALADPSSPVACPKGCDVKPGPDQCNTDCLCKDGNNVCGTEFPDKCGFKKDSLYSCSGALAEPSRPQTCTFGPCLVIKDKNDICTPDPCLCTEKKRFCSNSLPATCGFSNNTVLDCSGSGVRPQIVKECETADTCVEDPVQGAICKCLPAESGNIINPYSGKCIAVPKLAVGEGVIFMNCSSKVSYNDWRLVGGRIKSQNNQFCLGYKLGTRPYENNRMIVLRCDSNEKTTIGWTIVNRESIMSGEGRLCVDIEGPIYVDGNPIIAYPCHGGENQLWTLPLGWGC